MASRPSWSPIWAFRTRRRSAPKTYTLIAFHEFENAQKPGGVESAFVMQRCLHCLEPGCVSACPTTALYRQADGPVSYNADKCIGCRYCQLACPWDVPTSEWNSLAPKISKCTHCADRVAQPVPIAFNAQATYRRREQAVQRQPSRLPPASRRARPTPCSTVHATRCSPTRTSASPTGPTGTSTTCTARRSWAGRACCTSRGCRSRNSASRRTGEKPFPAFTTVALGAVPPP